MLKTKKPPPPTLAYVVVRMTEDEENDTNLLFATIMRKMRKREVSHAVRQDFMRQQLAVNGDREKEMALYRSWITLQRQHRPPLQRRQPPRKKGKK